MEEVKGASQHIPVQQDINILSPRCVHFFVTPLLINQQVMAVITGDPDLQPEPPTHALSQLPHGQTYQGRVYPYREGSR